MADSAVEVPETPVVEKETVTSPVKESPVKETNGSAKTTENGNGTHAEAPKENGKSDNGASKDEEEEEDDEETSENGAEEEVCPIKRKSGVDAEVPTPEKKAKVTEDPSPAEESNDAEVEA